MDTILFIEGIVKIANFIIAIIAGAVTLSLIRHAEEYKVLRAWKVLIVVLILFVVQQVLGALRAFQIFTSSFLTHIIPSFMLGFFIWAIVIQMGVVKDRK